jgi:hypothetical protein
MDCYIATPTERNRDCQNLFTYQIKIDLFFSFSKTNPIRYKIKENKIEISIERKMFI